MLAALDPEECSAMGLAMLDEAAPGSRDEIADQLWLARALVEQIEAARRFGYVHGQAPASLRASGVAS
jgi:hypothetical protein